MVVMVVLVVVILMSLLINTHLGAILPKHVNESTVLNLNTSNNTVFPQGIKKSILVTELTAKFKHI